MANTFGKLHEIQCELEHAKRDCSGAVRAIGTLCDAIEAEPHNTKEFLNRIGDNLEILRQYVGT